MDEPAWEPTGKTYEIKTMQDLFEVVNSRNVKCLCDDLTLALCTFAELKEQMPDIKHGREFSWTDDGITMIKSTVTDYDGNLLGRINVIPE